MQSKLKLWQPHLIALGLFILIPVIYFWPAFQGKVLEQGDIDHFYGVTREIMDYRAKFHTEPLWTNALFCGMPAYQVSTFYPGNLMAYVFNFLPHILPFPISTVFLSCLCFYVLMNVMKVNYYVGILGSFAYAFSSFFFIILTAGHNSEANAAAFMPLVLAGFVMTFNGNRVKGTVLTALAMAFEMNAGHVQITYYLFILLGIYGVGQFVVAIKEKQLGGYAKSIAMLAVGIGVGIATNITSLWLTQEYSKYSTRGKSELTLHQENKSSGLTKEYATQWCYGVGESMTLFIPDYKGGASEPIGQIAPPPSDLNEQQAQIFQDYYQYFGEQPFTSGPVYVGAIICFLALMGMFIIKGPIKWALVFATALCIALSWGKNPAIILGTSVFDFFFDHVPKFNDFRAVSMILVIAELTLPILAALALDKIVKDRDFMKEMIPMKFFKSVQGKKIFFIALAIAGGFAAICYIAPAEFTSFQSQGENAEWIGRLKQGTPNASDSQIQQFLDNITPSVETVRKKLFTGDAGRSLIFVLLTAGVIWLYAGIKKISVNWFIGVLIFFVVWDMSQVNWRYLDHSKQHWKAKRDSDVPYEPDQADLAIMQDTTPDYRVYNTTVAPDQDSRTSYFHKSLGGYSGVKMKRYDELLPVIERMNMSVINMLNAKYFVVATQDGKGNMPQRNPGALGNAWFVHNYMVVADADSEITALNHFDPKTTAIVDARFKDYVKDLQPSHDSASSIKMKAYEPNDLVYNSQSSAQQLAVFSEMYYKDGWDAFIDGKPSDYIRVNYVLRAMIIPAGNHTIEFKFEPKHYAVGEKISLASSLLVILSCLGLLYKEFFSKKPAE